MRLEELGVEIMTQRPVSRVERGAVLLGDDERIATRTVVWAGGLAPHTILTNSGLAVERWGLVVRDTLQAKEHANVFVAGDAARLQNMTEVIPATVPVAYTQGALVAENIIRQQQGQALQPYVYRTVGALIAVGGKEAIVLLPGGKGWSGRLPWVAKKVVSLRYWSWYLPWWRALSFWWRSLKLHTAND